MNDLLAHGALWPAVVSTLLALWLVRRRLALDVPPPRADTPVSVIVPMRNEEGNAAACTEALLRARGPGDEILVVDDHSTDGTARVVREAGLEPISAPPLPQGWFGKAWACEVGGRAARNPVLLFIDADVRVEPDSLRAAAGACAEADWFSAFPRQVLPTMAEWLGLGPLMAARLASSGPVDSRRAGCGQFFALRAEAWQRIGGHGAVRADVAEDMMLGRRLHEAGLQGRVAFGVGLASARMYPEGRLSAVWRGWVKNMAAGSRASPEGNRAISALTVAAFANSVLLGWSLVAGSALHFAAFVVLHSLASFTFAAAVRPLRKLGPVEAALFPAAMLFMVSTFARSLLAERGVGGGAEWKGRVVTGD